LSKYEDAWFLKPSRHNTVAGWGGGCRVQKGNEEEDERRARWISNDSIHI